MFQPPIVSGNMQQKLPNLDIVNYYYLMKKIRELFHLKTNERDIENTMTSSDIITTEPAKVRPGVIDDNQSIENDKESVLTPFSFNNNILLLNIKLVKR